MAATLKLTGSMASDMPPMNSPTALLFQPKNSPANSGVPLTEPCYSSLSRKSISTHAIVGAIVAIRKRKLPPWLAAAIRGVIATVCIAVRLPLAVSCAALSLGAPVLLVALLQRFLHVILA